MHPGNTPEIGTVCPRVDKVSASAGEPEIPKFSEQRLPMDP